jgi:hypothetical protein
LFTALDFENLRPRCRKQFLGWLDTSDPARQAISGRIHLISSLKQNISELFCNGCLKSDLIVAELPEHGL